MPVLIVAKFEHFFRAVAELDIDRADVKRYTDFINARIADLLYRAQGAANANVRQIIEPQDLPIAAGLEHCMQEFRKLDKEIGLRDLVDEILAIPPLDYPLSEETEQRLPMVAGGISVALARGFKIIDPNVKNPQSVQWERATRLFELIL